MGKLYDLAQLQAMNKEAHQLAQELKREGFYPMQTALEVVTYWKSQGLTIEQIREEYHLGGRHNGQ